MYPDFIGIGAQKAGTTWLHRNLQLHPQIWMPRKEVHYFDRKIHERSNVLSRVFGRSKNDRQWRRQFWHWLKVHTVQSPSVEDLMWDLRYYMRPYDDRWYGSIFEPKKGRIAGEITPAYSALNERMVSHVHELVPEAKIVFMMRNPVERAWSQAVMSFDKVEKGAAEHASDEEMLEKFDRPGNLLLTNYLRTLENWGRYYPRERIFVGFLEDVHFFPEELLAGVYEFLGVEPSFRPPTSAEKIHSRSADTMPTRLAAHLARNYRDELGRLEARFGGYAAFWAYCAERLVDEPPEGEQERIPYPFWESSLWRDWVDENGGSEPSGLRSGRLSSIEITN